MKLQALRTYALELGFDAAQWVAASTPEKDIQGFKHWLEAGQHAGMDYLERNVARRADVRTTFAPAQSALVLMVSHNHAQPDKPSGGTRVGQVARYAWSYDYHSTLKPVLLQLEQAAAELGIQSKACIDHAPILERGFAARAGLGWQGRSSQLIHTQLGALTTLAVLLTDLEVEARAVHPDRCGKCTACISTCPTNAIEPNRTVDSRLCIAYYTVEHRGAVPIDLRKKFGTHLFGCDDCLEICPWTTHAGRFSGLLNPEPELVFPNLEPWFLESGTKFEKDFANTAFSRARRKGMARNAAYVLGNEHNEQHLWLLQHGLTDLGWEVREACAWAIGCYANHLYLLEPALYDPEPRVQTTVARALKGEFISPEAHSL
jgi:epoxyqueuosine reductase